MAFQSLYRRYRSQTFAEVLGQGHVTTALRNAVREDRVAQGYLFSGPRGTGKTSTARILAKVLNCENPTDGEPCTECVGCLAVENGQMVDWLHELDAASNGKVDDIRALLERVSMGTSGRRKVYILDEVHMLSPGASNALLKTLEEPPDHVVFVLATTEPHKVLPTIRSRTQHFEFQLLPATVLADHVRHVIDDAELGLGEDAVEYVVRAGGGSARDTLTALDQVAAAGGVLDADTSVTDVMTALGNRDAGAALAAVADAMRVGREARVLGEAVIDRLRTAFLVSMGATTSGLSEQQIAEASAAADAIGPAGLTRALEAVGKALIEIRQAADPRIPLEVALVRLTRPDTSAELSALVERIERLEAALAGGVTAAPAGATGPSVATPAAAAQTSPDAAPKATEATAPSAPEPNPAPIAAAPAPARGADAARAKLAARSSESKRSTAEAADAPAAAGRPSLGGVRRNRPAPATPTDPSEPTDSHAPVESREGAVSLHAEADSGAEAPTVAAGAGAPRDSGEGIPTRAELEAAWPVVLEHMARGSQARFKIGRFVDSTPTSTRLALPNEPHRKNCETRKSDVTDALTAHFGRPIPVELVVDGEAAPVAAREVPGASKPAPAEDVREEEVVDVSDLRDAPDAGTGGLAILTDAFPGAEISKEQPS